MLNRKQTEYNYMILFLGERRQCEHCSQKYKLDDLIQHVKNVHHVTVFKCRNCGMEFLHEKERLHHVREENERKADTRRHKQ